MLPFASCISFLGEKIQTDFSSFMFHIQATSQKTLVFTPMLIKVNYFVVLGHWYKTCALLSLCNVQKFKISGCIQHKLMIYLCFSMWFKAFFFFSLCSNYFCFSMPNALTIPVGFFFSLLLSFYLYDVWTFFFLLEPSPGLYYSRQKSNPSEVILPMKTLILNRKLPIKILFFQRNGI